MFPLIATAGAVAFRNAVQNKPEYKGHPKIIIALIGGFNLAVGVANGNLLPATAYALYASVAINVERKITPGGGRQILRDIKGGFVNLFGGKKKEQAPLSSLVPVPLLEEKSTRLVNDFSEDFGIQSKKEPVLDEGRKIKTPQLLELKL